MEQSTPAIPRRYCANHPQRPAIGVCVITTTAICGECSTRYEGVNYSKEGLRILRERRAADARPKRAGAGRLLVILAWCTVPLQIYLVYQSYVMTAVAVFTLLHWGDFHDR